MQSGSGGSSGGSIAAESSRKRAASDVRRRDEPTNGAECETDTVHKGGGGGLEKVTKACRKGAGRVEMQKKRGSWRRGFTRSRAPDDGHDAADPWLCVWLLQPRSLSILSVVTREQDVLACVWVCVSVCAWVVPLIRSVEHCCLHLDVDHQSRPPTSAHLGPPLATESSAAHTILSFSHPQIAAAANKPESTIT